MTPREPRFSARSCHQLRPIVLVATLAALGAAVAWPAPVLACTNFLISAGASADGSTMVTYAADSHGFYGELYYRPPGEHVPGARIEVHEWDTGKYLGEIAQAPVTYSVIGNMNEHQVSIGESTWGGRPELRDPEGILDYGSLMYIALQRARTAREAVEIMTGLVEAYGYASTGESFSIGDPDEVWIMDLIGKGAGRRGAVWVARRVPDGYITGHANAARIRRFPLDDPEHTLYAPDVIELAREKGWFAGDDEDFSFVDAYDPDAFGTRRFCEARVWCMFERAAPAGEHGTAWIRGEPDAEPVPLWIRPERKLTVADVMSFMRDHFEGTELDMTTDVGAGPYALPYRWRPMTWEVDGRRYFHERAVSTQQTGFSFVAQMRSWLPDPIGGIHWFGVDDTYSTVYFPAYAGITEAPYAYREGTGSFHDVDYDAAFWAFNRVANFAYLRYADMIADIQQVQQQLEGRFRAEVPAVDAAAVALYEQSPRLAKEYLTRYSGEAGNGVVARWNRLFDELLYTYLDGNVKDEFGKPRFEGYPEPWYRGVAEATGDRLAMRKVPAEVAREEAARQEAGEIARAVVALLEARGLPVTPEQKQRILDHDDPDELRDWLLAAATAESAASVVGGME
ncbi:MAG: C69 family dipeptidase [Candidatus Krumholzibacteriia bacterium]